MTLGVDGHDRATMAERIYEVSFKGAASDALAGAFEDCDLTVDRGVTIVRRAVPDQAVLQGLIARIHALGLELLGVRPVGDPTSADDADPRSDDRDEE